MLRHNFLSNLKTIHRQLDPLISHCFVQKCNVSTNLNNNHNRKLLVLHNRFNQPAIHKCLQLEWRQHSSSFSTIAKSILYKSIPSHCDHHHHHHNQHGKDNVHAQKDNNIEDVPVEEVIRKEEIVVVDDNKINIELEETKKLRLGGFQVAQKMFLSFTCTVCSGSNSYNISKQAYTQGVVIVTCNTCKNNHLIADNLGWFEDVKGKNIEEIMEEKGEKVQKFISSDIKEVVPGL